MVLAPRHSQARVRLIRLALPLFPVHEGECVGTDALYIAPGTLTSPRARFQLGQTGDPMLRPFRRLLWHASLWNTEDRNSEFVPGLVYNQQYNLERLTLSAIKGTAQEWSEQPFSTNAVLVGLLQDLMDVVKKEQRSFFANPTAERGKSESTDGAVGAAPQKRAAGNGVSATLALTVSI